MPNRYQIRPFDDSVSPQELLDEIGPVSYTGNSPQWAEIVAHLRACGVRTFLIQERVRDPDFTEEYEAFYSKQHRDMSRFCVRVHAFREPVVPASSDEAKDVLKFIDAAAQASGAYLGFVTLRPLRHAPVGATILVDGASCRSMCRDRFPVHIAGTSFEVEGTPYLQQENAVAACAQASIWMALRTLRKRFGSSAYSPAELTLAATKFMAVDRVFPGRRGLRVEQMLSAIQESDHDPLVIPVRPKPAVPPNPYEVMEIAQPYIESGLPVIVLLEHDGGGHAVVAIGLAPGAPMRSLPPGLVIHNDNQGPYRLLPFSPVDGGFALNQCMTLIVPLPRGILMSASEAGERSGNLFGTWLPTFVKEPAVVTLNDPNTSAFVATGNAMSSTSTSTTRFCWKVRTATSILVDWNPQMAADRPVTASTIGSMGAA